MNNNIFHLTSFHCQYYADDSVVVSFVLNAKRLHPTEKAIIEINSANLPPDTLRQVKATLGLLCTDATKNSMNSFPYRMATCDLLLEDHWPNHIWEPIITNAKICFDIWQKGFYSLDSKIELEMTDLSGSTQIMLCTLAEQLSVIVGHHYVMPTVVATSNCG